MVNQVWKTKVIFFYELKKDNNYIFIENYIM